MKAGVGTAAIVVGGATAAITSGVYDSISTRIILPPGPVPLTFANGIPCSNASRLASGEARILSVESRRGVGAAGDGVEATVGAGTGAEGVGVDVGVGSGLTSSGILLASEACSGGASVGSEASASKASIAAEEASSPSSAKIAITDPTGIDLYPSDI